MPSLHRCDGCNTETLDSYPDEWFHLNRWGHFKDVLIFCSEDCISGYFNAKKLIEGIIE